jgi:hypothetical protein
MTTDEQQKKTEEFLKDYGELVKKHGIDILAYPSFRPNDNGTWEVVIHTQAVPAKEQLIKSPFVPDKV